MDQFAMRPLKALSRRSGLNRHLVYAAHEPRHHQRMYMYTTKPRCRVGLLANRQRVDELGSVSIKRWLLIYEGKCR